MECPKCQTMNPEDKEFCRQCGVKLSSSCPRCTVEILPEDFPSEICEASPETHDGGRDGRRPRLKEALRDFERDYILKVVDEVGGDKRLAAEILDVDLSTLYRKLR